jgi:RNA polymerase sigma-70 factor (ECF subfamily)
MDQAAPLKQDLRAAQELPTREEAELIRRTVQGDTDGFRELVYRYQRQVYASAYRAIGDHAQAEDVAQEVFLKVFRSLPQFKHEKPLAHWIHRIASNAITDQLRRSRPVVSLESMERMPASAQKDPQDVLSAKEGREALRRAIGRLPKHYRQALALQIFQEYSYQEIASALDIPIGTVMSRLSSAKRLLRHELRAHLKSPE